MTLRGVLDWRLAGTVIAGMFVLLLAFTVYNAVADRQRALDIAEAALVEQRSEREALLAKMDVLELRIIELSDESARNGQRIARMRTQVQALRRQLEQAGIEPVVPGGGQPRQSHAPDASQPDGTSQPESQRRREPDPRPKPSPRPPPDDPPPDDPPPEPVCVPVLNVCL